MPFNYDNIPEELRWCKAWCVAGPGILPDVPDAEGILKPDKRPYMSRGGKLYYASSTNSSTWSSFEDCSEFVEVNPGFSLGFVLSEQDGYVCLDLDTHNTTKAPEEQLARFEKIITTFDSYTERSYSGNGFHVFIRGKAEKGCQREGIEVYPHKRFIIFTGNTYLQKDIAERQELLDILISEISAAQPADIDLEEIGQIDDDGIIYKRASAASNSGKFLSLWSGAWTQHGYTSQSEADLSLLSMLAFYSKSNEQCRRLFRYSGLGKRDKAVKNNTYLDRTLKGIRARQAATDKLDKEVSESADILIANYEAKRLAAEVKKQSKKVVIAEEVAEPEQESVPVPVSELEWPPGLAGEIARYMFNSSIRPVKEVSIVATMGLLAGIVGKAWTIPQSGLNSYIILVARSGVGKEAMHGGIANLMTKVLGIVPSSMKFVDFTAYASGQALIKAVASNPCFLNIHGEFGKKLVRLSNESTNDIGMSTLRTVMTDLYQKSGPTSIVGGIGYSDKEKNIASISGVSYSMIGESTPDQFYNSLTESMMEDGFLSRFTIIDYVGDRPPENENTRTEPDMKMLEMLCDIVVQALTLSDHFTNCQVALDPESRKILKAFNLECDKEINSTDDEKWRQMWNRAHLKAYRFSAILAVADNHLNPVINKLHVEWAIALIRHDISLIQKRIKTGDVGTGDGQRERKLLSIIKQYLAHPIAKSYNIPDSVRMAGLVSHRYLMQRVQAVNSFTSYRLGLTAALDFAIRSLITCGYIVKVEKTQVIEKHGYMGEVYKVVNLPLDVA